MVIFSILWIPVILLFLYAISNDENRRESRGKILSVLGGCIFAIGSSLSGPILSENSTGFMHWLFGFVDVVAIPVLVPLGCIWLLSRWYKNSKYIKYSEFALLWLILPAVFRGIQKSAQPDAISLIIVPLLWSCLAISIPFLAGKAKDEIGIKEIAAATGAIILPFIGTTAYWGLFVKFYIPGLICSSICIICMIWALMSIGKHKTKTF